MDGKTINVLVDGQSQLEETSEARLPVQEGDKMVRLPSTEFGDTPVQEETVDPSINNEGIWAEELPTATDIEEVTLESPVQSSEVQGNGTPSKVLHFT